MPLEALELIFNVNLTAPLLYFLLAMHTHCDFVYFLLAIHKHCEQCISILFAYFHANLFACGGRATERMLDYGRQGQIQGGGVGDRPPKTCESCFIHHDFV